jgi:hypothetical protein
MDKLNMQICDLIMASGLPREEIMAVLSATLFRFGKSTGLSAEDVLLGMALCLEEIH